MAADQKWKKEDPLWESSLPAAAAIRAIFLSHFTMGTPSPPA
jgi:hypothetical protein